MEAVPYFGMRSPRRIGEAIRDARKSRGLAQADVAAAAGISRETLSRIETEHSNPRIQTLVAVLRALELEIVFWPFSMDNADTSEANLKPSLKRVDGRCSCQARPLLPTAPTLTMQPPSS